MFAIGLISGLILAPVVIVTAFFALEILVGLTPLKRAIEGRVPVKVAIVVPAHNEEAAIASTIDHLKLAAGRTCSIVVVADNCSDGTAAKAAATGATVLVRTDVEHRGKGYALALAREHLRGDPPELVVIIDADCRLDEPSFEALTQAATTTGRACQAVYLLDPAPDGSAVVQISTFAFAMKNLVRQRGLQRLAGRAHLTGTGMAFPWAVFATADLGGSNIVEDLALGLKLADTNAAPMLVEGATVWSPSASVRGTLVQRQRWEGGYLATALKVAPGALMRNIARGDLGGIFAALDLSMPPLALLVVMNVFALLGALAAAFAADVTWPLFLQVTVSVLAALALSAAWAREGRRFASVATLIRLPLYVLWKLPMYLRLVRQGSPKEWVRTER